MKKWQRMTLTFGLASTLLVPSFTSASMTPDVDAMKEKARADMKKNFKSSNSEQKLLAYQKQQENQEVFSNDTIIVKYETKLSANVHRKSGAKLERTIPSLGYDIVKLSKGQKLSDVLGFYAQQEGVISVQPSVTYKKLATNADPKTNQMYHLSLLNIDKALSLAGKNEVTVAVIDSGLDMKHPELKSQVLPPYNVLAPANQGFTDVHGTHVAGIIAAEKDNAIGGHGINPNAKILPIDVFNGMWGTSDYAIAEGVLYAVSKNVKVINMSLGGSMKSPILEAAIKKAVDAGITVVASAGNNYGESVSYPAAYEGVISVSATNWENKLAEFSSYGAFVDIAAPGEAIYNSVFDPMKGSSFAHLSGTSMASPIVAGVASLLLSKYPDLKPFEVEAILKMTAKDLGDLGYDTKYGAGLVDAVKALQFDLKNLPKSDAQSAAEAKAKAVELTNDKEVRQGKTAAPGQTHWFKMNLEKGQGAQALLDAAKNFNYQLAFDFVPTDANGKAESRVVDESLNGKQEAGFFTAKEAGTLYIGVKDVYGHYSNASTFTLTVTKEKEMIIDNVTAFEPIVINKLPFTSTDASTLTFAVDAEAKEADKDYFRFTVEEPTMVKFDLSAVPGINSSVGVYFEQDFLMPAPPNLPPGAIWQVPMIQYVNSNGMGEGEKVTFEAMPGMSYLIEVSAEPRSDYWYEMMMGMPTTKANKVIANSNVPYSVKVEKTNFGVDEDGFPFRGSHPEEAVKKGEMTKEAYMEQKRSDFKLAMEKLAEQPAYRYMPQELVDIVKAQAVPFNLGEKLEGKFQFSGDEDFYKFTADANAIYELELNLPKEILPWVQIMEYDAKNNDLLPVADIWTYDLMWGYTPNLKRTMALEAGKEYYVRFMNERYQASDEAYVLTSKKLADVPASDDMDENREIRAKVLAPGQSAKNDFVYTTDTDYYYYKHTGNDKHLSLTVQMQDFTEAQLKQYPKELLGQLIVFGTLIEDTNGNLQIDEDEYAKSMYIEPSWYATNFNIESSFKAKKNVGYFMVFNGFSYNGGVTVQNYEIALHNWNTADEDAGSVVKGNVPSKPIALKTTSTGFEATGYFNPGIDFGDKDYYSLKVDKYSKLQISLETPGSLDGSITIFDSKGKKMARMDHYGMGDAEVGTVTLPKGQYYILVEDSMGFTSLNPYKLTIKK
jgi:serine protease